MASASPASVASLSFARTHIKSGDNILLRLPSGDYRNLKVHDKPGRITLGKFGSFQQQQLIGHPYGLSYEIIPEGKIRVREPETMAELGGLFDAELGMPLLTKFFLLQTRRHKCDKRAY